MKYALATLSGMVVTLCVFVGGAAFAIAFLTAKPVPVERPMAASAQAFTTDPVRVTPAQREWEFDRVEPRPRPEPLPEEVIEPALHIEVPELEIDEITTASVPDPEVMEPETVEPSSVSSDHVAWCSNRYRSYRAEDNSYTPYRGGSRECISPFSEGTATAGDAVTYVEASAETSYASAGGLSPKHLESCFARYRSYRSEDNTYQPYGGGPRRQCQ